MITYLLRFIWAVIFSIMWIILNITALIYVILFVPENLKGLTKEDWLDMIPYGECDYTDWFTFSKEGEWKSIFHWAFKIQKH